MYLLVVIQQGIILIGNSQIDEMVYMFLKYSNIDMLLKEAEDISKEEAIAFIVNHWEGNGKSLNKEDVNPEEFRMGEIVESEHTKNPKLRERIILDHLFDNDCYYSDGRDGKLQLEELSITPS